MLAEDFLTHREAQARAAIAFGRFEDRKNLVQPISGNAHSIVGNNHGQPLPRGVMPRGDFDAPAFATLASIECIGADIEDRPMQAF